LRRRDPLRGSNHNVRLRLSSRSVRLKDSSHRGLPRGNSRNDPLRLSSRSRNDLLRLSSRSLSVRLRLSSRRDRLRDSSHSTLNLRQVLKEGGKTKSRCFE
jgi:hypothetical protein